MDDEGDEVTSAPAPQLISGRVYGEVLSAFQRFAWGSEHADLCCDLLRGARESDGLPDGDVVTEGPVVLRDRSSLSRALGSAPVQASLRREGKSFLLTLSSLDDELWDFASHLEEERRLGLDVALRRALNPMEALATYPLEALFRREEADWLKHAPRDARPAEVLRPHKVADGDMDYIGYVMAICKFTRLCNLRCTYCHDWRSGPNQRMPFAVQGELFRKLLGPRNHSVIHIVWHGGEPTLIGRRGFLRILMLQRWFRRPNQLVENIIQTNATTLGQTWIRLFQRYRFQVGVSIDGPIEVHDRTRLDMCGRPTFHRVHAGLRALRQAGMPARVILVVGRATIETGAERLVKFLQEEGVTQVAMLAERPSNGPKWKDESYLDPRTYVHFLLRVHEARKKYREPWLRVRELDTVLDALQGRPAAHCELLGNCIGSFFLVDIDGSVAHCDKFVGDPDYTLGNILHQDFQEIRASEACQRLMAQNQEASTQKASCPYFRYCRGWCPHERYLAQHFAPGSSTTCCGLDGLFCALSTDA